MRKPGILDSITFYLTPLELEQFKDIAESEDLTLSALIRQELGLPMLTTGRPRKQRKASKNPLKPRSKQSSKKIRRRS